jgi:hypothetical protein
MIQGKLIRGKEFTLEYIRNIRSFNLIDMKAVVQKDLSLPKAEKYLKL